MTVAREGGEGRHENGRAHAHAFQETEGDSRRLRRRSLEHLLPPVSRLATVGMWVQQDGVHARVRLDNHAPPPVPGRASVTRSNPCSGASWLETGIEARHCKRPLLPTQAP